MGSLSLRLKERRIELGLTQLEVSKKIGWLNPQFVSNIENGRSFIPISRLKKYSKVLKMDYDELYKLVIDQKMKNMNKKL